MSPAAVKVERILVPTDVSESSRGAFEVARAMSEKYGARVDLLHVWERLPVGIPEWNILGPNGDAIAARTALEDFAVAELKRLVTELRASGFHVHGRLEEGSAWRAITRVAAEDGYDLIVMSTHGRTGLGRVIGSVAEKVVRHATCPVLVVPLAAAERATPSAL